MKKSYLHSTFFSSFDYIHIFTLLHRSLRMLFFFVTREHGEHHRESPSHLHFARSLISLSATMLHFSISLIFNPRFHTYTSAILRNVHV